MTRYVDPVRVGHLARLPGADKQDLGTELVGRFAETLVTLLPRLRALAVEGDADTIMVDSHSLRGSAGLLGAVAMADTAQAIEENARAGDLSEMLNLVERLESDWRATQPELRAACVSAASEAAAVRSARATPPTQRPAD